jgi:aspartate aminotransferase
MAKTKRNSNRSKTGYGGRNSRNRSPHVHLNLNVRGMGISATLAINDLSNQLRKEGRQIYKLGLGQSPFPVPTSVVDELKTNAWRKEYLPVQGLYELRQAVADYHRRSHRVNRTADCVLIGPGSKELMFLLQLVYYGDLVIPTPAWVSYAPQARIIGRQVHFIHTRAENNWKLMADELEEFCLQDPERPRIVVLNYPSNPTGKTYTMTELKAIARVAADQGVVLLSDEIYGELHHRGRHVSVARFYPEGTIISGGLSKWCGAGGWRLGTFTFPQSLRWLLDAMAAVASETYTSTSAPIQYAAVRAFTGGIGVERYLRMSRRILSALGRTTARRLSMSGVRVHEPDGGFYLFPDFSPFAERLRGQGVTDSDALCRLLLEETGVALLPGTAFGRDPGELTARLSYVDFDGARALYGADSIPIEKPLDDRFLQQYCGPVMEAMDRMCEWVGCR